MKKRIVIAGFGDTGLLVAINLGKEYEVIGISPKPCLVSGQELGTRLTSPGRWKQNYLMSFDRFEKLDHLKALHGVINEIDTSHNSVNVNLYDGSTQTIHYDVLVIASGVSNGFWRTNHIEDMATINRNIANTCEQINQAKTIAIIGGGASGVSVASNIKEQTPEKQVNLFYSQQQPLPGYHPKTRNKIQQRLTEQGVLLHPHHRACIPPGFKGDKLTTDPVEWQTGQAPFQADITLWAIGQLIPNNGFIPPEMLNEDGFVKTDRYLRVPGFDNVFAVGDIAATDPSRSSARNAGFLTVAANSKCYLNGNNQAMKTYKPSNYRWGSILGVQKRGMLVYTPTGGHVRFTPWFVKNLLFPYLVRKMIYKGVKPEE